jgi:hypothetical protein
MVLSRYFRFYFLLSGSLLKVLKTNSIDNSYCMVVLGHFKNNYLVFSLTTSFLFNNYLPPFIGITFIL